MQGLDRGWKGSGGDGKGWGVGYFFSLGTSSNWGLGVMPGVEEGRGVKRRHWSVWGIFREARRASMGPSGGVAISIPSIWIGACKLPNS